ncbi:MAG: OmpA family protein [Bergeyella cardium]|uniref:OmpA family protein n=1 Tax=Bergeyella cardium TaxID=1585976 RepID=UPI000EA1FE72|nr:OmpA family protein [Bergeyella cardium]
MKLSLLLAISLPIAFYAQEKTADQVKKEEYPNTFSSGSANVSKFTNQSRSFNDWAISAGGGTALMSYGDLTSFYDGKIDFGWNAYLSVDKQITHTFGLSLQYQTGKTNQKALLKEEYGVAKAWSKYNQISLLGDINLTNLLRRVDNNSAYKWALHGYAGIGLMSYKTYLEDSSKRWNNPFSLEQDFDFASFFFQTGVGVKYNLSRRLDLEARAIYVITGDDEFDGGGEQSGLVLGTPRQADNPYNYIKKNTSDNYFTVNIGVSAKLGKHNTHLAWFDPLQDVYYRTALLENKIGEVYVCEKGDKDRDGVCDDWDRQLDTPFWARVDGAGVALDIDLDGVIDLYDKCVTVPGVPENKGCPLGTEIPQKK